MITPQDIRDKTFEKAVFGGYDMGSVDDFLDAIASDLTATQKEISVLKAKMKVLVDKIEEYRSNEDALNRALLSAQKLSVQIEADARHKADIVLAEANNKAQAVVGGIENRRVAEEARLAEARKATASFLGSVRQLCNSQMKNLDDFTNGNPEAINAKVAQPAVAEIVAPSNNVEETIKSIEDSVARIQAEPETVIHIDDININTSPEDEFAPTVNQEPDDDTQLFMFNRRS